MVAHMENKTSRTRNVAKNAMISLLCQFFNILIQFVGRTIFISVLGKEYLGVNGLFTNILTMLSFAELGIGSAMIFSMYKPLSIGDTEKLKSIMALYRKAYCIIGLAVAGLGICVIPFLDRIVGKTPDIPENIVLLYLLFLLNSTISYFFVYKKSIITADQKLYVVNIYQEITGFIQVAAQCAILLLTGNYILYLLIQIACTLLNNIWTAHKANKMYPYLKEKADPLPKEESKKIFKNVKDLALYKFGSAILNGTDNLIISTMFSVISVGLVSNYVMITNLFTTVLSRITNSFTASVGNLNAVSESKKQHEVFVKIFFLSVWLFGFASYGMMLFLNDIIELWVGADYLLDPLVVFSLVLSFYVSSVQFATYTFRTTLGLFHQGRFAPVIAAVVNIAFSVLLGWMIGLSGVFFATAISRFFVISTIDAVLIYKHGFHNSPKEYFGMYIGFLSLIAVIYGATYFLLGLVPMSGIIGLLVKIAISTVLFNGVFCLIFRRTEMFKEIKRSFILLLKRKKKNDIK